MWLVGVQGGGFGLGLALAALRLGHRVVLRTRQERLRTEEPHPSLKLVKEAEPLGECEIIFLAVPSAHIETVVDELGGVLDGRHLVVHVSRGLVGDALIPISRLIRERTVVRRVACLAGPVSAECLTRGLPGGGIVGTEFPEVAEAVRQVIGGPSLRLYETRDVVGCEVASALVGLLVVALGYAKGHGYGPSSLATLLTRGLAEAVRIGTALGAQERTFFGMAGVGDLIAAVGGDERPEFRLGQALARGLPLEAAGKEAGAHIEGISIARRVHHFAERKGIEAPISQAIADIVEGKKGPQEVVDGLMRRRTR
ncbi:MAG: NAD(P)-binding domain-containing protein, partial [Sandaracinaceae bacterium]|nr:NAD(P)-binding domain-containing protein [Sandaracinaceae bacterium]